MPLDDKTPDSKNEYADMLGRLKEVPQQLQKAGVYLELKCDGEWRRGTLLCVTQFGRERQLFVRIGFDGDPILVRYKLDDLVNWRVIPRTSSDEGELRLETFHEKQTNNKSTYTVNQSTGYVIATVSPESKTFFVVRPQVVEHFGASASASAPVEPQQSYASKEAKRARIDLGVSQPIVDLDEEIAQQEAEMFRLKERLDKLKEKKEQASLIDLRNTINAALAAYIQKLETESKLHSDLLRLFADIHLAMENSEKGSHELQTIFAKLAARGFTSEQITGFITPESLAKTKELIAALRQRIDHLVNEAIPALCGDLKTPPPPSEPAQVEPTGLGGIVRATSTSSVTSAILYAFTPATPGSLRVLSANGSDGSHLVQKAEGSLFSSRSSSPSSSSSSSSSSRSSSRP